MKVHHIETTISEKGKLSLHNLPFKKGDEVEIIILERSHRKNTSDYGQFKGMVIRDNDPLEPAASPEDWEILK